MLATALSVLNGTGFELADAIIGVLLLAMIAGALAGSLVAGKGS